MGEVSDPILITGAAGYLGRATVRAARRAGHEVIALLRSAQAAPPEWAADDGVSVLVRDLADLSAFQGDELHSAIARAGCVIHAAAALRGDDAHHARQIVGPTQALIDAMRGEGGTAKLILVSSLAVHDVLALPPSGVVNEATPLERDGALRDAYCRAKLGQEAAVRAADDLQRLILRPGVLFDRDRLWNAHLGPRLGSVALNLAAEGEVPLCHVDNCAEALVRAVAVTPEAGCEALILLDPRLPTRSEMLRVMRQRGALSAFVTLPWALVDLAGRVADRLSGARGLMRRAVLHARMKPLRYDAARARSRLGWQPERTFFTETEAASDTP